MAAIDLIVLGMLKNENLSAYDIQKLVEYRHISNWVKVSTPSIYKKVIQLEKKSLIKGTTVKEGKMPEKTVYSLTHAGEKEFEALMLTISEQPINLFLDFNAVIVNIDKLTPELRNTCLDRIKHGIDEMKFYLEKNLDLKNNDPDVPKTGLAVLHQQYSLIKAIEDWLSSLMNNNE